jgi:benzoylformate decarboxylase
MDLMDPPIDFVGLARSFGLRAERVDKLPDVSRALSAALVAPEPSLIEVATDPAFGPV